MKRCVLNSSVSHLEGKTLIIFAENAHGKLRLAIRGIRATDLVVGVGRRKDRRQQQQQEEGENPLVYNYLDINYEDVPFHADSCGFQLGSKVYFVGGSDSCCMFPQPCKSVVSFDFGGSTLVPKVEASLNFGKSNPLLATLDGKIYAIPGPPCVYQDGEYALEVYTPSLGEWQSTGFPYPPFLLPPKEDQEDYCSAVVIDGVLHVATNSDGYCFNPKSNEWDYSLLFDSYKERRPLNVSILLTLRDIDPRCPYESPYDEGFRPFDFVGHALVLQLYDDVKVLIGFQCHKGHGAFLLVDGKVVARQSIGGGVHDLNCVIRFPHFVDLGSETGGEGLFCSVWSEWDDADIANAACHLKLCTYRVKLLKDWTEGSKSDFLHVDVLSSYCYTVYPSDGHLLSLSNLSPINCFLMDTPSFLEAQARTSSSIL